MAVPDFPATRRVIPSTMLTRTPTLVQTRLRRSKGETSCVLCGLLGLTVVAASTAFAQDNRQQIDQIIVA